MAISIVSEPDAICLVRQPAPLVVSSNNYITTPGVKAHSFLEITSTGPVNNETFQIVWNGKTIVFTAKTSPSGTTEFPLFSGGGLDDYANDIISVLLTNDLLTEEIVVTLDGASSPTLGKIKFEARYAGTTYNIALTESMTNTVQSGNAAGVDEIVRTGMKITMDVYAEDVAGSNMFELAGKTEADMSATGSAVFFLNRILHDFCRTRYYIPSIALTGNALTGLIKRYYTVLAEKYDSPPALHNTYNSNHLRKRYILGGNNYGNAITNAFTANYITDANGKKFLTKRPARRYTRKAQSEFLYCYVNSAFTSSNIKISVTAWNMSNVSYGAAVIYSSISAPAEGIHCFAVGYTALNVESMFGGEVYRYKVQITFNTGTTHTEEIEYIVDRNHYYTNETFFYVNGFGCTETLWVHGDIIEKPILDRQPVERMRLYNDTVDVGEYLDTNPTYRKQLEVNVGYLCTREDSEWVADVLNTTQLWWYRNSQMQPLQITDKETAPYSLKQNVRDLKINCIEGFDNNTI
jgi:hypothetical protein